MSSLSKSIAVKPFLMKTVSESHLIDDDASSQNGGAGKQVPSSQKTKKTSYKRVPNQTKCYRNKNTLITIQTSLEDSSDFGTRRSWDEREGNIGCNSQVP